MKIFFPLLILIWMMAGCATVPVNDAKMSVGLASSQECLATPSEARSAELKARYVAQRALGDFSNALTAEGRDWRKHGVYIEALDSGEPVAMMNQDTLF